MARLHQDAAEVIMARSVTSIGRFGSDRKLGNTGKRFVRFGVEHMEDGADEQRVTGLLPMVAAFERALRVHQHVGNVLDVAHLPFAPPNLQQRIVGRRLRVGRIEQQHAAVTALGSQTSGSSFSPLMSWTMQTAWPRQQRRHDEADAFAGSGRAKHSTCSGPSWRR